MGIIDFVIIGIFLFGIYLGYQSGAIKELADLIVLFISSIIAGLVSDILFGVLYKYFPFFNFSGKAEGLKSINIILWKLILYILLMLIIIYIVKKICVKTGVSKRVNDSIPDAGLISKLLALVISIPLMLILTFNISLIALSPNFNLKSLNNSKIASTIMTKTPILSRLNHNLYRNEKYIINRINKKDNTRKNYKKVNKDIIQYITNTNLVSEDKIKVLNKENKLVGKRK